MKVILVIAVASAASATLAWAAVRLGAVASSSFRMVSLLIGIACFGLAPLSIEVLSAIITRRQLTVWQVGLPLPPLILPGLLGVAGAWLARTGARRTTWQTNATLLWAWSAHSAS